MKYFRFKDNQTQKKNKNKESVFNDIKNTTKTKTSYQFNGEIKDIKVHEINKFDNQNNEVQEKQTGSSKYIEKLDNLKIKYKQDPKKFVILASSFLLLLSLVIGTSFATLSYLSKTTNTTKIETGTLALELKNESNQISFDGAIPQEDKEALEKNSEYTFTVKNNGSIKSNYKVILENTCTLNKEYEINGEKVKPDKCIPNEYVKVGLKKDGEEYKVLEYDKEKGEYILETGMLSSNEEESYKMKVWLDYDTPNDYNSKGIYNIIYSAKLAIDYEQTVTEKVEVKYTVKYDANGGSGTMANTIFEAGEEKTLSKNTFTRNGYEFIGWALVNASNKVKYVEQEKVKNLTDKENETITLYAIWKGNEYTITYYLGNGTSTAGTTAIGTSTCTYNSSCTLKTWETLGKTFPGSTNKWSFAGWTTSETGTNVTYTDGKQITYTTAGNINLYAIGSRTFKFYSGTNGSLIYSEPQYWNPYSTSSTYATSIDVPTATAIDGWKYYGYRANNTAGTTATIKTAETYKGATTSLTSMDFRTIYSRDISVTYNANGGTGTTTETTGTQYFNSGMTGSGANTNEVSLTLATNGFTKSGYSFTKWTEESTSGTEYSAGVTYSFDNAVDATSSVTMYAKWTPNTNTKYTVNHYVMDTSGNYPTTPTSTENKTGTTAASLTLANLKLTTVAYNVANGIIYSHGTVGGSTVTTTTIAADGSREINLYYKRTYGTLTTAKSTNVTSVTVQNAVKYYYGATVPTLTATLSIAPGYTYTFSKWTSSNTTYLADKTTNPTETFTWPAMPEGTAITLTAGVTKTANTYTIEYYTYDGSTKYGSSSHTYDTAKALTTASDLGATAPEGKTFYGWATSENSTEKAYDDGQSVQNLSRTNNGVVKLYAIWQATSEATFYYYDGSAQASATDDCAMYNAETSCEFTLPTAVSGSSGPSSTEYKGVSVTASDMTTTTSYTSANTTYYAVYDKKVTATFYYNSNTSSGGFTKASATASGTRTASTDGTIYTVTQGEIEIPSVVGNSVGKYNSANIGVANAYNSMTKATPGTSDTSYYAIYRKSVTIYYPSTQTYSSTPSYKETGRRTHYRNEFFTNSGATSMQTRISSSTTGTSNITTISGIYSTFRGLGTAFGSSSYGTVASRAQSTTSTFYAVSGPSATITYDANGGTGGPDTQTSVYTRWFCYNVTYSKSATSNTTISSSKPTYDGYAFIEWNTNADGTGTSYIPGKSVRITSSRTLYAQWGPVNPTANLTVINGTIDGNASISVANGESVKFTTTPASEYYDLAAYACTGGKVPTFTDNTTLTIAKLTQNTNCTVEYHKSAAQELIERAGTGANQPVAITQPATDTTPALTEYRYMGKSPYNFVYNSGYSDEPVTLNTHDQSYYRVIGVFYTDDGNGNYDYRLKVMRNYPQISYTGSNTSIGGRIYEYLPLSWDTSASAVNSGYGSNQWGESGDYNGADIMRTLNPGYEDDTVNNSNWWSVSTAYDESGNSYCYNGANNSTRTCSFHEAQFYYDNYVDTVKWYTGAVGYSNTTPSTYTQERSATVGTADSGQTITKTSTWTGKVGLPSASDYGYASSTCYKDGTSLYAYGGTDYRQSKCTSTNWMYRSNEGNSVWLMTPDVGETATTYEKGTWVKRIDTVGCASAQPAAKAFYIRPTMYLKPDVMFDYVISNNTGLDNVDDYFMFTVLSKFQTALENSMS